MSQFKRNTDGQFIPLSAIFAIEDGTLQTSGISCVVSKDGSAQATAAGTLTMQSAGDMIYAPTAAETDCALLVVTAHKANCTIATTGVYTTTKLVSELTDGEIDVPTLATELAGELSIPTKEEIASEVDTLLSTSHGAGNWDAVGSEGTSGPTASEIYDYFVASDRADAFKADISALLTASAFGAALPTNFNLFSIDGSGKVQLTAAAMSALFDDTDAATLLSDFFTGLIERFDASGDTAVSTIATAVWGYSGLAAAIRAAIGMAAANLDSTLGPLALIAGIKTVTDKLGTTVISDGAGGYQFTILALANAITPDIRLSFADQDAIASIDDPTLTIIAGDDYTGSYSRRIDIESEDDLTGKRLIIAASNRSTGSKFALAAAIEGTAGSHFVTFDPPGTITKNWAIGTWTLQYKLESETGKVHTLNQSGTLVVKALVAPEPFVII